MHEMTAEQRLLELRDDKIKLRGLKESFRSNCQIFGIGYALKQGLAKLRFKKRGMFEVRLKDLETQIQDDLESIRKDPSAPRENPYRSMNIAHVEDVLDRLEKIEGEKYLSKHKLRQLRRDTRRYLKEHQDMLAAEMRKLKLDEECPEETTNKKARRTWNWIVDNRRLLVPLAAFTVIGGGAGLGSHMYIQHKNRNRTVVEIPAEVIQTNHPGVEAARDITNAISCFPVYGHIVQSVCQSAFGFGHSYFTNLI